VFFSNTACSSCHSEVSFVANLTPPRLENRRRKCKSGNKVVKAKRTTLAIGANFFKGLFGIWDTKTHCY
jgi:hypothetical protein